MVLLAMSHLLGIAISWTRLSSGICNPLSNVHGSRFARPDAAGQMLRTLGRSQLTCI